MTAEARRRHPRNMTGTEKRVAAVELALVELAAWMEPGNVRDAMRSVTAGLKVPISEEEAEVRLQAVELLKEGLQRFDAAAGDTVLGRTQ